MSPFRASLVAIVLIGTFWTAPACAALNITLNLTGWTPSQEAIFHQAETFWETSLTGYQPGITLSGLTINGTSVAIDGAGGVLGSAGPTNVTTQAGFTLTTLGNMRFDTADVGNLETSGRLLDVIKHEMGHVLGLGTLWTFNNVYVNGTGQFTGARALEEFKVEFNQPTATFVPVELGGGSGTANGHWNEVDGGAGLTGLTDTMGRDMAFELMTGWLNTSQPSFVSRMTLGSFEDIGFTSNLTAVPEPTSLCLLALGLLTLRRRRPAP